MMRRIHGEKMTTYKTRRETLEGILPLQLMEGTSSTNTLTSGFQNYETINFCCRSGSVKGLCYGSPGKLIQYEMSILMCNLI